MPDSGLKNAIRTASIRHAESAIPNGLRDAAVEETVPIASPPLGFLTPFPEALGLMAFSTPHGGDGVVLSASQPRDFPEAQHRPVYESDVAAPIVQSSSAMHSVPYGPDMCVWTYSRSQSRRRY